MQSKKKILDKIEKLLQLATSDNSHEAATALDFAQKLLNKYKPILSSPPVYGPDRKIIKEPFNIRSVLYGPSQYTISVRLWWRMWNQFDSLAPLQRYSRYNHRFCLSPEEELFN